MGLYMANYVVERSTGYVNYLNTSVLPISTRIFLMNFSLEVLGYAKGLIHLITYQLHYEYHCNSISVCGVITSS
jgi:hypothetical protein